MFTAIISHYKEIFFFQLHSLLHILFPAQKKPALIPIVVKNEFYNKNHNSKR